MIGRASIGNPWIFEEIINYLEGKEQRNVTKEEKLATIIKHIELEIEEKGEIVAIKEMRKHLAHYIKNTKDASIVRQKINMINAKDELIDCLNEYFENM